MSGEATIKISCPHNNVSTVKMKLGERGDPEDAMEMHKSQY